MNTMKDSAVFSDFAAPLQDFSCGPGAGPDFFGERHRSDFLIIFGQNSTFWSSLTLTHD